MEKGPRDMREPSIQTIISKGNPSKSGLARRCDRNSGGDAVFVFTALVDVKGNLDTVTIFDTGQVPARVLLLGKLETHDFRAILAGHKPENARRGIKVRENTLYFVESQRSTGLQHQSCNKCRPQYLLHFFHPYGILPGFMPDLIDLARV